MDNIIKISDYKEDPVGYCGICDGEYIELAPIVIECTLDKEE